MLSRSLYHQRETLDGMGCKKGKHLSEQSLHISDISVYGSPTGFTFPHFLAESMR